MDFDGNDVVNSSILIALERAIVCFCVFAVVLEDICWGCGNLAVIIAAVWNIHLVFISCTIITLFALGTQCLSKWTEHWSYNKTRWGHNSEQSNMSIKNKPHLHLISMSVKKKYATAAKMGFWGGGNDWCAFVWCISYVSQLSLDLNNKQASRNNSNLQAEETPCEKTCTEQLSDRAMALGHNVWKDQNSALLPLPHHIIPAWQLIVINEQEGEKGSVIGWQKEKVKCKNISYFFLIFFSPKFQETTFTINPFNPTFTRSQIQYNTISIQYLGTNNSRFSANIWNSDISDPIFFFSRPNWRDH